MPVKCPKCDSDNCKMFWKKEVLIHGSAKTTYKANFNPFKPFTIATAKTKYTDDVTYDKQMYRCLECEYEFVDYSSYKPNPNSKLNKKVGNFNAFLIEHKILCNILSILLFIISFLFIGKGLSFFVFLSLISSLYLSMVGNNILICAFDMLIMTGYIAFLLGK